MRAAIPIMYRATDLNGFIVDCNEYYAVRLGYNLGDVIGVSILSHSPAASRDNILSMLEAWKTKPESHTVQPLKLLTKRGEVVKVIRTSHPRMKGDKLVGIDSELRDTIAIKKIQEIYDVGARSDYEDPDTLRRSVDYMGTIVACSQSYLDELGYTRDEVIGISLYEHTAPRSQGNLRANMENWRAGYRDTAKIWMRRKDGSEFPVILTSKDEKDKKGLIVGRTVALKKV